MNAFVKGGGSGKEGYGFKIRRVVREVRFLLDGILDKRCDEYIIYFSRTGVKPPASGSDGARQKFRRICIVDR